MQSANTVQAGTGDDVVVAHGSGNKVYGGSGKDKLYALTSGNKLLGETNDDYLSGSGNTAVDGGDGNDECHITPLIGKQVNCESSSLIVSVSKLLGL